MNLFVRLWRNFRFWLVGGSGVFVLDFLEDVEFEFVYPSLPRRIWSYLRAGLYALRDSYRSHQDTLGTYYFIFVWVVIIVGLACLAVHH